MCLVPEEIAARCWAVRRGLSPRAPSDEAHAGGGGHGLLWVCVSLGGPRKMTMVLAGVPFETNQQGGSPKKRQTLLEHCGIVASDIQVWFGLQASPRLQRRGSLHQRGQVESVQISGVSGIDTQEEALQQGLDKRNLPYCFFFFFISQPGVSMTLENWGHSKERGHMFKGSWKLCFTPFIPTPMLTGRTSLKSHGDSSC